MLYQEFEYKGHQVRIEYDEDGESPRDWDPLATMACFHSRYTLGDVWKEYGSDPTDFLYDTLHELGYQSWVMDDDLDYNLTSSEFIQKYIEQLEKRAFVLPLYLYDHSGITMNTTGFHCQWDSGQVGWIYVPKEKVREEYKVKRISPQLKKRVYERMVSEVVEYDDFLTGNVFGYIIKRDGVEVDSCCGYYGDPEDELIPTVKKIIDNQQ